MRRAAALLLAGALVAACGDDDRAGAPRDPFAATPTPAPRGDRAAPRWERVARLTGRGDDLRRFMIRADAIQWRALWRCSSGRLSLTSDPAPADDEALADASCPDRGRALLVDTGAIDLRIRTPGRWSVLVEQQVDTPLEEPEPPGAGDPLLSGRFYGVERSGRGTASIYRGPAGRLGLRLEGFSTAANADLYVWLSRAARPRTSRAALAAPHQVLGLLKATRGSQNYLLPAGFSASDVRSIVIWCEPVRIAYAAAALRRP